MSYRLNKLRTTVVLLVSVLSTWAGNPKYAVLITIDGLRPEMISDPTMPTPFLKMMKAKGLSVDRIEGIPPASTYPSHTTLVTGVRPAEHGIYYNRPFLFNKDTAQISYWYASQITAPTIWHRAKEAGLTTASLFWPVSTGSPDIDYNVPEFWSLDMTVDQMAFLRDYCTPRGLLGELEQNACGKLDWTTYRAGSMQRDGRTAAMACYLTNRYQPRLMTIHIITTDYAQHADGLDSQWIRETVASADHAVGSIIENLRITGRLDSTFVVVTGDHGFTEYQQTLAPNVWLVRQGLLSQQPGGAWQACFHADGNTAFLHLKDRHDKKTLRRVQRMLTTLPEEERQMFRVVSAEELAQKGADPHAALALEPIIGVSIVNARVGAVVNLRHGGTHGFLSGQDQSTLVAYGAGMPHRQEARWRQTEIAGWILQQLGVPLK